MDLTQEERNAINSLKRLARRWPDTLWMFAGGQDGIAVMKLDEDGKRARSWSGSVDPGYCVGIIEIPSDGGDW